MPDPALHGNHDACPACALGATDIAAKLRLIAGLSAGELPGYEAAARERGLFDGEMAALVARRAQLGVHHANS